MDFTVNGHVVNVASRLCEIAGEGEILTEPQTYDHAEKEYEEAKRQTAVPRLQFKPRGEVDLKNIAKPIEVIEVVRALGGTR
jgi:class 3 adenylate cyclase